jgi:predicted dehydrogenase
MSSKENSISRRQFLHKSSAIVTTAGIGAAALQIPGMARAAKPGKKVKIGQIGTGHPHAGGKIKTIKMLADEFELVGIAEPNEQLRKEAMEDSDYQGVKWMTVGQLLNTKGLQAVTVETKTKGLLPTGLKCIDAGMHIHLDKPAGETLSTFKKLLDNATAKKLTIQMGYMFRYNLAFQFCLKALHDGWLGDIFEVHGVIGKSLNAAGRKDWDDEFIGGTIHNLGSHLIDMIVAVLGRPDKVTAYNLRTRPQQDNLEDNQLAVLEYPRATATIRSAVMEVDSGRRRQFVVCGDKGTVDIKPLEKPKVRLALDRARGKFKKGYQDVEMPDMPGRYYDQLIDFARVIRGEKQADYSPEHDYHVQETILKACDLPLN